MARRPSFTCVTDTDWPAETSTAKRASRISCGQYSPSFTARPSLTSLPHLYALAGDLSKAVSVDSTLSTSDIQHLLLSMHGLSSSNILFATVPYMGTGQVGSQSVVNLNPSLDPGFWHAFEFDTLPAFMQAHGLAAAWRNDTLMLAARARLLRCCPIRLAARPASCLAVRRCILAAGAVFVHDQYADPLDRWVGSWATSHLGRTAGAAARADLGQKVEVIVIVAIMVLLCLAARRVNGAVLAAVSTPAAAVATEKVLKPLAGHLYSYAAYPSGHATSSCSP